MLTGLQSRLLLVAAAVLFSTGGAAIKATSLTSWQVASFRSGVAAVALLLLVPESRKGLKWKTAPASVAYAATLILFVLSTKLTTAANAIFLQSTAPAYLLILGPLLLHERLTRRDLGFAVLLATGMAMFFLGVDQPTATAPNPAQGNLLAAASGIAWALTLAGLRWQAERGAGGAALATVVLGNLFACGAALTMALPVTHWSGKDWSVILYLGVVQIGLAYFCLTKGMRQVPAFEASTILLIEPVLNPLWAWAVHGEMPSRWASVGATVILLSTLGQVWSGRDRRQKI